MRDHPATTYAAAGVDIAAGDRAVELMKSSIASTARSEVLGTVGGFSGAFAPNLSAYKHPVLLSSTDGVGTKLAIAQTLNIHDTVGIDLVAMVVDDLVCDGGEALFLLDYIACGRLVPERIASIVSGIAEGCRIAGCALIGGETAEHPGLMDADAYDLAAFAVGVVDRDAMLGPSKVRSGDVVLGLASSGLHSNGYSLVRKLILEHDLDLFSDPNGFGKTLGEVLLTPTRIHSPALLKAMKRGGVHAAAHITGGGLAGNLIRSLPEDACARIERNAWDVPPIVSYLAGVGGLEQDTLDAVFNLGIGMTVIVDAANVAEVRSVLEGAGEKTYEIGVITSGPRGVILS
ncbi:MAG: phosphoribosylformylglycinamidine cyclo-ligase [Actinomycetota bacterium]